MTASDTSTDLRFEPPGPGTWKQDAVHFPRPMTRYFQETHPPSFKRGTNDFARFYGGPLCDAWPDVLFFKPPAEAHRLAEKALELERKGKHVRAAECYRAALDQAEMALGTDHGYLAWILVRYWLALRHAGQHGKATRVKPRADAMWAKYGMGHLSE